MGRSELSKNFLFPLLTFLTQHDIINLENKNVDLNGGILQ